MSVSNKCSNGHVTRNVDFFSCRISPSHSRYQNKQTIQCYLTSTQTYSSGIICGECGTSTVKCEQYHLSPSLLPVYIEGTNMTPDDTFTLHMSGEDITYVITGVIYYGASHFMARYVDAEGIVWFNDGYVNGRVAIREGIITGVDMSVAVDGRTPVFVMCRRLDDTA
ncbi:hypothetical protein ARMGADRAFT_937566 [Armillaria gallica]|uniref:Uncharacterized protein n=1 Tax=Armillaria gallica TaxID=47427 RepID=A0A2H3D3J4_ARMGA|nr:hypothetical protein ARMGADRAFT_937566 [Armillaria gallica]